MARKIFTSLAILVLCQAANAAMLTYDGNERGLWKKQSLILGKIVTKSEGKGPWQYSLDFMPVATLAGHYDTSRQAEIKIVVDTCPDYSAIRKFSGAGTMVMVVIFEKDGEVFTDTSNINFSPDYSSVMKVDDLEDARIWRLVEKVRELQKNPPPD